MIAAVGQGLFSTKSAYRNRSLSIDNWASQWRPVVPELSESNTFCDQAKNLLCTFHAIAVRPRTFGTLLSESITLQASLIFL
ncbi:hypothetical protein V6N11_032022 [Hibiscus sabdariffa]|uniref:Uncharacterized protein n=1 Tax=Hibiscus sabdariffa TaxID=183260 RepID=A0ABR2SZC9_9ROSI